MRVVVASPTLPLPFGATDARWLSAMTRELVSRGIDVCLVACTEESPDRVGEATRWAAGAQVEFHHVPFALGEPTSLRRFRNLRRPMSDLAAVSRFVEAIDANAGSADVVHLEHMQLGWLAGRFERSVLYLHHLEEVDWEDREDLSSRERFTLSQHRRSRRRILTSAPRVIVTTARVREEVRHRIPRCRPEIVPICIDPAMYERLPALVDPVVGVIGSMHWYPSRAAASRVIERIWPHVREKRPDARMLVAGWNVDRYFSGHVPSGVELVSGFPHPRDAFSRIQVLLYPPPKGSGMKVKVLEAMAYGVPVVANIEGAEGIDHTDRCELMVAESDDELIARTLELLDAPATRHSMSERARDLVVRRYSPEASVDRLLEAYAALLGVRL